MAGKKATPSKDVLARLQDFLFIQTTIEISLIFLFCHFYDDLL